MSGELERVAPSGAEAVPSEGVVVVVPREQEASGPGEGDGGDAAENLLVSEDVHLVVAAEVKEAAGGVV